MLRSLSSPHLGTLFLPLARQRVRNYFIIVVAFPFILPTTFFGLQKKREEEEKLSPYWAPWPLFVDWRFTLPKKLSVDRLKFQGRHCALGASKNGSAL